MLPKTCTWPQPRQKNRNCFFEGYEPSLSWSLVQNGKTTTAFGNPTRRCGLFVLRPMSVTLALDNDLDKPYTETLSLNSIYLANLVVLTRRKPKSLFLLSGLLQLRLADRTLRALLFQLPPRITRLEPPLIITPIQNLYHKTFSSFQLYLHD